MPSTNSHPNIAIACGGTGGHLFPGLAVGGEFLRLGWGVTLLISPKEVDQAAVRGLAGMRVATIPAVGLSGGNGVGFIRGLLRSHRECKRRFQAEPPSAVLAMGGFTAAPPVVAGGQCGAKTFLHESNAIPGRANRWLARWVGGAFVGFPEAGSRLRARSVTVTGTPVRPSFRQCEAAACRRALGLNPDAPVLLVMGGSQGASGINELVLAALPTLQAAVPELQFIHVTGMRDIEMACERHTALKSGAVVQAFSEAMDQLMGAATMTVSRAGASSLAEIAALRLPAILVPYPTAADNHQWHNAHAFEQTGAAVLIEQKSVTPALFANRILGLLSRPPALDAMRQALVSWDKPTAAGDIAATILNRLGFAQGRLDAKASTVAAGKPTAVTTSAFA